MQQDIDGPIKISKAQTESVRLLLIGMLLFMLNLVLIVIVANWISGYSSTGMGITIFAGIAEICYLMWVGIKIAPNLDVFLYSDRIVVKRLKQRFISEREFVFNYADIVTLTIDSAKNTGICYIESRSGDTFRMIENKEFAKDGKKIKTEDGKYVWQRRYSDYEVSPTLVKLFTEYAAAHNTRPMLIIHGVHRVIKSTEDAIKAVKRMEGHNIF